MSRTPRGMAELSGFRLSSPDTVFGPDITPSLFSDDDPEETTMTERLVPERETHPIEAKGATAKVHVCGRDGAWPFPGVQVTALCGRTLTVASHYVDGTFSYVNADRRCRGCAGRVTETAVKR